MRQKLRGTRGGAQVEEHIDAAAVIAQALNRLPPPPATAEPAAPQLPPEPAPVAAVEPEPQPPPVGHVVVPEPAAAAPAPAAEPEPEPAGDGAAIMRVPYDTPPGVDPLADDLLALGKSLGYDVTSDVGVHWVEIVVELPPDDTAEFAADVDGSWVGFTPSAHSRGVLEVLASELHEIDPGAGFDVVIRARETILCRWPSRAWHVRDADLVAELLTAAPDAAPAPVEAELQRRRNMFRRRATTG